MADTNPISISLRPGVAPEGQGIRPVGYGAPAIALAPRDEVDLKALAAQIVANPLALQRFSDRVYQCLQADLAQQRSRWQPSRRGGY